MPRNGSGTYTRPQADYVPGTTILATSVNSDLNDMAQALTASIARDGQTTPTANIPLGGFRITGLGNATAATDAATLGQLGGAPVVLATSTASASATLDISSVFNDALYARYELELIDLVPATNDVQALLRVGTGAGPTWQAGVGAYNSALLAWATSSQGYPTAISNAIALSQQPGGGQGVHSNGFYGLVRFWTPQSARIPTFNIDTVQVSTAPVPTSVRGSAIYGIATAITGLRFLFSSGNIASGSIRLLGYRK
jgi:hypothetical protein